MLGTGIRQAIARVMHVRNEIGVLGQETGQWHSLSGLDAFGYTGGVVQARMAGVRGLCARLTGQDQEVEVLCGKGSN